ncbi:bifunctional 2-polyprenyl-6-hydroxyphenol methylase/3-demethylubiquinol 3-O-methyltransferase UbiG [Methylorubrum thiocyanatum]|uniref:bifunctional 2-polyprenyl-6-hydroxyphenol methylase/3-demethylubiquinol 3-O-methyltransferase UbiG n=1 Tax=Methylorubrum thiocyanatum TaxID=47958 RepID=UPI00383B3F80
MSRMTGASIDRDEVARFDALAARWWDERGPMAVLHKFNPVRVGYIRDEVCRIFDRDPTAPFPLEGLSVIDIGCGGGVLSEPLARLGATVTGLDPATGNIAAARAHAEAEGLTIEYRDETIEAVAARGERFDVVLAMEVVEHVSDRAGFLRACCTTVKPGGLLFAATINRTMRSFALAIVGAEYVLRWLPRGTHDWEKFVTPRELTADIAAGGLTVTDTTGVVYNPLNDSWRASRDTGVNYMVAAHRPA